MFFGFLRKAALRVTLAVTWLTVYRQLQIPAQVCSAQTVLQTNCGKSIFDRDVLRVCLSVFDETLHANFYWYGIFIPVIGMSGYALSVEHALGKSIFFGATFMIFP